MQSARAFFLQTAPRRVSRLVHPQVATPLLHTHRIVLWQHAKGVQPYDLVLHPVLVREPASGLCVCVSAAGEVREHCGNHEERTMHAPNIHTRTGLSKA
jgi:hypothetical protein